MFEYSLNGDEEESNNSSNSGRPNRRRRNPNQQEEEKKLLDSDAEQYIDPTLIVFPDGTVCIGLDHKNPSTRQVLCFKCYSKLIYFNEKKKVVCWNCQSVNDTSLDKEKEEKVV